MTTEIAIILLIDGIANGAIYLLAGLGLVLIFSVTRVVFVPFGDITAFCALSIAAFELGKVPGAIWVVAILALVATMMDAAGHIRSGEIKRIPRSFLVYGLLPLIPCVLAWLAAGQPLPHAVQIVLALALVLPIAPLLDRRDVDHRLRHHRERRLGISLFPAHRVPPQMLFLYSNLLYCPSLSRSWIA